MSLSPLETLVRETKLAFILAKSDGVLDASEVIQIAVDLAQKIQKLGGLPGAEKKAVLLHTLKRALDTSGGIGTLPGFATASDETKSAFEEQLINTASAAIDAVLMAASGKLDLRKPSSWAGCLPLCLRAANVMLPKDQKILKEAVSYSKSLSKSDTPSESVDIVVEVGKKDVSADGEQASVPGTIE